MPAETYSAIANGHESVGSAAPTGSVAESAPDALMFGCLAAQLACLVIVIKRFNLESPAFLQLSMLMLVGFSIHYWLPLRFRLSFFLVLSLAGLVLVLGTTQAAWLVGIGMILIGICHLPVPSWIRVALLVAAAGLLTAMRVEWIPTPWPVAIWPILGSMFMFRLLVYLYDLTYRTAPTTLANSFSYFFMLPNVCFPLFPVVDYQSFVRNYYDAERHQIYQVGVRWIFRGVIHLVLYRILYKNYAIGLYDVANAGDLVHYCLWLFLLYLRVSGQFHIIVGMLHLFGFNLAETHHLYYLASSFSDFWRRINIYWKDFMMKLFFYPMFFRLRSRGPTTALIVSTLMVFVLTWFLHAVQWFWLRGSFLLAANDVLFWSILAVLVVVNSFIELKYGRQRALTAGDISWTGALRLALQTLATFTVICILWSLWTSESLTAWLTLWQFLFVPPTANGWLLIVVTAAVIMAGAIYVARRPEVVRPPSIKEAVLRCAAMVLMTALSTTTVDARLGRFGKLISSARSDGLNTVEMANLERGYYEDLLAVDRFNGELWRLYMRRPLEQSLPMTDVGINIPTHDIRRFQLKPLAVGIAGGVTVRTNSWGMHDDDYEQVRPPGCYRIALLGASCTMAAGVERDYDYETLLENQLNRESNTRSQKAYEILNFAVWDYSPLSQVWAVQEQAFKFDPNAVLYVGHPKDQERAASALLELVLDGSRLPYPYLRELVRRADIDQNTPEPILKRRIAPYAEELLSWVFSTIKATCDKHNVRLVYVIFPLPGADTDGSVCIRLAKKAGLTVVDLSAVFEGKPTEQLRIADWDFHPNVKGHKLIAQRLYETLHEQQVIPLPTTLHTSKN